MATKTTEKGANWGKLGGPTGQMQTFTPTGTQTPDRTSQEGHSGSRTDIKVQAGGADGFYSEGATNKSFAGTQTAGQSASQPSGGRDKFAKGGSTSMFGNRGSIPAKGGQSAP